MTGLQCSTVGYLISCNQDSECWQIKGTLHWIFCTPSFLSGGQLSGQQAIQSRLIASVCIKVENAIKHLKDFKIFLDMLCNCINKKQRDNILIIVCALCNTRLTKLCITKHKTCVVKMG